MDERTFRFELDKYKVVRRGDFIQSLSRSEDLEAPAEAAPARRIAAAVEPAVAQAIAAQSEGKGDEDIWHMLTEITKDNMDDLDREIFFSALREVCT
jgi:hypothetical protein